MNSHEQIHFSSFEEIGVWDEIVSKQAACAKNRNEMTNRRNQTRIYAENNNNMNKDLNTRDI